LKGKDFALRAVQKIEKDLEDLKSDIEIFSSEQRTEFITIYNEKMSLLAIANYNLGSQHEFLDEYQDAIGRYELALSLV
jgi:NAD-dependent SIR2 family protein deacetylase